MNKSINKQIHTVHKYILSLSLSLSIFGFFASQSQSACQFQAGISPKPIQQFCQASKVIVVGMIERELLVFMIAYCTLPRLFNLTMCKNLAISSNWSVWTPKLESFASHRFSSLFLSPITAPKSLSLHIVRHGPWHCKGFKDGRVKLGIECSSF